jgi:hypothetical protein
MKPIDYLKALGLAVAILALNLLATTLAITIYSLAIAPGQPQDYYVAMAPVIGAWTGPLGGMLLMFGAGWLFARRRPEQSGLVFIGVTWGAYVVLDVAIGLAAAPPSALFSMNLLMSLGGAGLAGLAGAVLAQRTV